MWIVNTGVSVLLHGGIQSHYFIQSGPGAINIAKAFIAQIFKCYVTIEKLLVLHKSRKLTVFTCAGTCNFVSGSTALPPQSTWGHSAYELLPVLRVCSALVAEYN